MDENERQRKLAAGRAKLASFRQKRAKGDGAGAAKKTQERKSKAVSPNDCAAQESHIEPALPAAAATDAAEHNGNHKHGETKNSEAQKKQNQKERPPTTEQSPSPVNELKDEELFTLTGKEQLKQLQQAVEKRNEIIARLSLNLQEALASRDEVQLEAQSLAGQIQALQRQLQQTSVEFLRIRKKSAEEVGRQHSHQEHKDAPAEKSEGGGPHNDDNSLLHKLEEQLEKEKENRRRLCTELDQERGNHRHVLSLLEEEKRGRAEERRQKEDLHSQLRQLQSQCLDTQRCKDEKEALNGEAQQLRRRLQEEQEAARRAAREAQEQMEALREEHREEVERVRRMLERSEEEVLGLKAAKNLQNQETAASTREEETGSEQGSVDACEEPLMERYLSSVPLARSPPPLLQESFDGCGQLDISGEHSFELNSEVFEDQPFLSISNRLQEESAELHSSSPCPPKSKDSEADFLCLSANASVCSQLEASGASEQGYEETDLEKELLHQQCGELREELALKERELDVLREEVMKSAEDLEEARSRWAQVSEELREALWELEEEKEKRRCAEEEMNLRAHEQDNLRNNLSALLEERKKEDARMEMVMEAEMSSAASPPSPATSPSGGKDQRLGEPEQGTEADRLPQPGQRELSEVSLQEDELDSTQQSRLLCEENCPLSQYHDYNQTSSALLVQRDAELEEASKELQQTHAQLQNVRMEVERLQEELEEKQSGLDKAERLRSQLESELVCLRHNLENLEEAQAQAAQEKQEHSKREEELDQQIRKMEQVLEEELEQFESLLKAKEVELADEKEKWEEEKQEKECQVLNLRHLLEGQKRESEAERQALAERQARAVEEAAEALRASHQRDVEQLLDKHQQEISELKNHLETQLLEQRATMEEEQRKHMGLIKQVTEREHERMISEMVARHSDELIRLKEEVSSELRDSLEAAHQAELQQEQAQRRLELEALQRSLTNSQESALAQAQHQAELDHIKKQNQELQERQHQQHQQATDELKEQWEARVAQERASMEEKHTKDIQTLRSEMKEAEAARSALQTSLSHTQNSLNSSQTELADSRASLSRTNGALSAAEEALSQTRSDLQAAKAHLQSLRSSSEEDTQKLREELKQALDDRNAAASALEELVSSHRAVLQEKQMQVLQLKEKESELQQEVSRLEEERESLKKSSAEEVGQLWSQLESMRTSRQELGELKEQLLARSSRVDDIERLKTEFNEQKREIKEQNEAELESLRRYFEQRLRASEENYREEIALLQLRLVETALEESVLKTTDDSLICGGQSDDKADYLHSESMITAEKQQELLDTWRLQVEEEHAIKLASLQESLALSYKEELQQVRSDLTDHYYEDLQELKTRHALELEQQRAKLSDRHLQEVTRIYLEASRQVEAEVEHRIWCYTEELHTRMTIIHTQEDKLADLNKQHHTQMHQKTQKLKQEFAGELVHLEEALKQEKECVQNQMKSLREELRMKHEADLAALRTDLTRATEKNACLQKALQEEKEKLTSLQDHNQGPEVGSVRQQLEAQYHSQLQQQKSSMAQDIQELTRLLQQQSEEQLQRAHHRFEEEKAVLEQSFAQKNESSLAELRSKLQAELDGERASFLSKQAQEAEALAHKHKAQLDALGASHREQLAATTAQLEAQHNTQLVALEAALVAKRKADLEGLESAFQETTKAQLEALEAALARKHQEEKDEVERRLLANMDTLEATYLKEIQTLRDEMLVLEEKHRQELSHHKAEQQKAVERHVTEQQSTREELKKELAQLHMDKFKAMAAELSHVHKTELAAQQEQLDAEHCKALETLHKQVLELHQQHSAALQELTQSCADEKEQLLQQHQVQLQELKGVSARELEACRREVEEESSRQRQHFLEEVELLKVQSEERLQDRINQLKTDLEGQKEAELEDVRRSFATEREEMERSHMGKMSQLTAQLHQLDSVVAQLRAEVGGLQGDLEGKRTEMETLDTLLQRRERESQEGGNLLNMLTEDLQTAKTERQQLQQANDQLKKVLIEMIRSTIATEDLIGQKINAKHPVSEQAAYQRRSAGARDPQESVGDLTSEELELTQQLCESLLVSDTHISAGGEEAALSACSRLRHTVDTLLELLNQANTQLEQTRDLHLSLEEKLSQGKEDSAQLLEHHKLLLEQIDQEAKLKSQLQLELHKAEGLLEGFAAEKATLEETLLQKEVQEERLVEQLEELRLKLQQAQPLRAELEGLRAKHQELDEEHAALLRQKEHLSADLGERERALLAETERLSRDKLDLQRQAEKDRGSLSLQLRALERELEEQETRGLETERHHASHTEDLNQRVKALDKQLKHNRQFIEEQAVEREHERDEFQQEIRRLEAQLRQTAGSDTKGHRFDDMVLQVESLQSIIKDKTEDQASLLAANQQAQRDLAERNEEIDKLAGRIRELEQALLNSAECNRSVSQLEQELHKIKLREQELVQDKQALEQQQLSNRLQISALQSKLDEMRHCYHDNTRDPTQDLRDALDVAQQSLQSKESEVEDLLGHLENAQSGLGIKEAELKHLTLQLELLTNQNAARVCELQEQIGALEENVSALTLFKEETERQRQVDEPEVESLSSALLDEKNQEIDQLNAEIHRLEQEIDNGRDKKVLEAELEDLSSQVEHLQSEVMRVRQDKEEEEERLHEVISTLQAELATLGPNLHEVSDSQDGDSINPSPAPSPEPHHHHHHNGPEPDRAAGGGGLGGGPVNLRHELSLTPGGSSRSLRSRLKALQSQLDTAAAEKEALERLLLTQETEYRGQGEELARLLGAERETAEHLRGLLTLAEAQLQQSRAQLEQERPDSQRERDAVAQAETLRSRESQMRSEMEALEQSVRQLRAEGDELREAAAAEARRLQTLETTKGELSAEREALRRRENQLQEEIQRLTQEVDSLRAAIRDLSARLQEAEATRGEAQQEALSHAEQSLAKADVALKQKETALASLDAEHQVLKAELTTLKQGLNSSTQIAHKLHEEGKSKDQALAELDTENQQLKAELRRLQEELCVQEEELAFRQRELQQIRRAAQQHGASHRDVPQRAFEEAVSASRIEVSLGSPEILRRLDHSEDPVPERLQASALGSRLSEISSSSGGGGEAPRADDSLRVTMEAPRSRTLTPDPASLSSVSPSSDKFSMVYSLDADKVCDLEGLDLTAPPSPLGSTSSLSAPEWASDGYGSNVSSELGARLRVELEQTERLDAQFVEYLRCRGMNPTANTDSAAGSMSYSDDLLSPELQGLLKKVYQESCRILTLSQRRATSSSQPYTSDLKVLSLSHTQHGSEGDLVDHQDKSFSNPPMSWQQEKRALQETVIALRELLCRMAQRRTETDSTGEHDWHREQQEAEGPAQSQIRAELDESQNQLRRAQEAQLEQNNKLHSLRLAVEECEAALLREQATVGELQQQLEHERALSLSRDREEAQRKEAAQASSEQQRSEVTALTGQLEQERVACSNLRRELQIEQSRSDLLEKRLGDTQQELGAQRHHFSQQQQLAQQEKERVEHLLAQARRELDDDRERRLQLDEERERRLGQLEEAEGRRRKSAEEMRGQLEQERRRSKELVEELRGQLEQERRRGEELAALSDKLGAELAQSRRQREEQEQELRRGQEESRRRHRLEAEALEAERERCRHQGAQLKELKEKLRLLNDAEREREERWSRERRKAWQEQQERDKRHERTNNKLGELERLRQQDQQRMQELQRTLSELERQERELAAERLSGTTTRHKAAAATATPHLHGNLQSGSSQQNQQSSSASALLETLMKENCELTERVTTLSQERAALKHRLSGLERQLLVTENQLAKAAAESENIPVSEASSHSKVQRLYERYLRAESARKALVFQKRYLLLLLGGYQECEQATLGLIARMGARPSTSLAPQRRPLGRFRAAVRAVIAISRMRFLTRKWQRAIRKLSPSATAPGSKVEVQRLQHQSRTKADCAPLRDSVSALVPPSKSPFRLHNRSNSNSSQASGNSGGASQDADKSLTDYIHHLEKVQQRLMGPRQGSSVLQPEPKSSH